MLLQNFDFELVDPTYRLRIKQTLTIKPDGFTMRARLRNNIEVIDLERKLFAGSLSSKLAPDSGTENKKDDSKSLKPMLILYGSNAGTCESLATSLAGNASEHGYNATLSTLDAAKGSIPKDQPIVIVTASYEGQPTDNAALFVEWMKSAGVHDFDGVRYAVFGCGHRETFPPGRNVILRKPEANIFAGDWQATFQKIPKLVDASFAERGAERILERGQTDVAEGDIFNDFDKWQDKLWTNIATVFGTSEGSTGPKLEVEINSLLRSSNLRQDVSIAQVISNKILTGDSEVPKRHIEIRLPTDMNYRTGDYLAVLPLNSSVLVKRVMNRFKLPWDCMITIKSGSKTTLPTDVPISAFDVLTAYVELNEPVTLKASLSSHNEFCSYETPKNLAAISQTIPDPDSQASITEILDESTFKEEITKKRVTILDILERYPTSILPFSTFLSFLPALRIRQYSISSSPLFDPTLCTLTFTVLDTPALANPTHHYIGTASHYLSSLSAGDIIQVSVRKSAASFHPPLDIENVPVIMICAGTGLAPFRGFVQERAIQIEAGRKLAPAQLYVGCRGRDKDLLHVEEFDKWEGMGAVEVFHAFSREEGGCKYVQERLWEERGRVKELFERGARVYVCGSAKVGEGVKNVAKKIWIEAGKEKGEERSEKDSEKWFEEMKGERYAVDVFT
jgi:cytochrome P450/NADPH-cytochrome P450 reductase